MTDAREQERQMAWRDELAALDAAVNEIERMTHACRSDYGPARLAAAKIARDAVLAIVRRQQEGKA